MSEQLKPCPFCGNEKPHATYDDYIHENGQPMPVVECTNCHTWVRAEAWNNRAAQPAPPAASQGEEGREVIGYTTPGMLEIARGLNGEGRIGVRGKRDERFSVPVYTSAQDEDWGVFIGYLIDKCEGHEVTEENLQGWMSEMLADPHYGTLFRREKQPHASVLESAQPARQVGGDERERKAGLFDQYAKEAEVAGFAGVGEWIDALQESLRLVTLARDAFDKKRVFGAGCCSPLPEYPSVK